MTSYCRADSLQKPARKATTGFHRRTAYSTPRWYSEPPSVTICPYSSGSVVLPTSSHSKPTVRAPAFGRKAIPKPYSVGKEKLAAVGRFSAEMAHEINNHLTVLLGVNEDVGAMTFEERRRIIEDQGRMLVQITSDIRDFALGAAMPFMPSASDPSKPVDDVLRACGFHPSFKNVKIRFEKGKTRSFEMDCRQIKHLFIKAESHGQMFWFDITGFNAG